MVIAAELVTAVIIAGTLSYLFAKRLTRRHKRSGFFWFFLLILMITWAGGVWLIPFGPRLMGIQWLPFVAVGLAGALVVFFWADRRYPTSRHETIDLLDRVQEGRELEKVTYLSLNILFWIVLTFLIFAILTRYIFRVEGMIP